MPLEVYYGLATLSVYAVNAWAARDAEARYADALGVSLLLCVSYLVTNATVALFGWPDSIIYFPFMDTGFCFLLWAAWKKARKGWMAVLMGLLVLQLAMHVAALYTWKTGSLTHGGLYIYATMLNGVYILQLLTVGGVGLAHALRRLRAGRPDDRGAVAHAHGVK